MTTLGTSPRPIIAALSVALVAIVLASCSRSAASTTNAEPPTSPPAIESVTSSTSEASPTTTAPDETGRELYDFAGPSDIGWFNQDDPVMGGRSSSRGRIADGALVFSGNVSLENNGGFASIVSAEDPMLGTRMSGARALRLRAVADGKTYVVQLRIPGQPYRYIQRLSTEPGAARAYELPLASFTPVTFMLTPAADAPAAVDASAISQVAFYVTDKQAGPFELRVERIDAVA